METKTIRSRRVGRKTYYGEEAELMSAAETMAHNTRMVQAKAGTYDFSNTLVPAPTRKPVAVEIK